MTLLPTTTRHHAGYTLLEMTLSLALLSIVMVGTGSAVMLAAQAMPNDDSSDSQILESAKALSRINEDLAQAKFIIEYTDHAVTIVVPDRTGDRIPDHIRYAWSGVAGSALTRSFNGTSAAIIDAVDQFELTYNLDAHAQTIPAPLVYGAETLVAQYDTATGSGDADVTATNAYGQVLLPILSADAVGFMPTRMELYGRLNNPNDGVVRMELRDTTALGQPGSIRYANATVNEAGFTGAFAWSSITVRPEQASIPKFQPLAMTFAYQSGSGTALRLSSKADLLGGQISSTDGGTNWSYDLGQTMLYRLYGQEVKPAGADVVVTHDHVLSIGVALKSSSTKSTPMSRQVRLLQTPELLDYFWEADFDVSPTYLDLDNDGQADWSFNGAKHIPAERLYDGRWNPRSTLKVNPIRSFTKPTVVELRFCAMNNSEAVMVGPLHIDENNEALPITVKLVADDSSGHNMVFYNDFTGTTPYGTVPVTKQGMVEVKLLVLPASDTVALWVEGNYIGSALFSRVPDNGQRGLCFTGIGNNAEFSYIRVSVGGTSSAGEATTTSNAGTDTPAVISQGVDLTGGDAEQGDAAQTPQTGENSSLNTNTSLFEASRTETETPSTGEKSQ